MLDIGWSEILIVLIAAVVFIGPEDLPKAMRTVAGYVRHIKFLGTKLQMNIDHMLHETEIHEIHQQVKNLEKNYEKPPEEEVETPSPKTKE